MNGQKQLYTDGWMNKQVDTCIDGQVDRQTQTDEIIYGWMNGWMDGQTDVMR